jgi:hypothetical protein
MFQRFIYALTKIIKKNVLQPVREKREQSFCNLQQKGLVVAGRRYIGRLKK